MSGFILCEAHHKTLSETAMISSLGPHKISDFYKFIKNLFKCVLFGGLILAMASIGFRKPQDVQNIEQCFNVYQ